MLENLNFAHSKEVTCACSKCPDSDDMDTYEIFTDDTHIAHIVPNSEGHKYANKIVTAFNLHDDLIKCIKTMLAEYDRHQDMTPGMTMAALLLKNL